MATIENLYTGDGSTVLYSFTFPYLATSDIYVSVDGVDTTAYTLANATTVEFNSAPANGAAIRVYRDTDSSTASATFFPGSAVRAQDLNSNFEQQLYVVQEAKGASGDATTKADAAVATANTANATANTANTNAKLLRFQPLRLRLTPLLLLTQLLLLRPLLPRQVLTPRLQQQSLTRPSQTLLRLSLQLTPRLLRPVLH